MMPAIKKTIGQKKQQHTQKQTNINVRNSKRNFTS